jgi:hypothetical protein
MRTSNNSSFRSRIRRALTPRPAPSFHDDPPLQTLVQLCQGADIDASVLVASRQTIERRMRERERREPFLHTVGTYPQEKWLRILAKCDIQDVYTSWIAFLDEWGVQYNIMQSLDGTFEPVQSPDDLHRILARTDD